MRQLGVAAGGLERVRKGVAEVERGARATVERVADAVGGLHGGAAAHLLGVGQLPQRLAGEQPRLHDLGAPLRSLGVRQRLEERRVDHDAHGPVKSADEVLAAGEVERGLAAESRVDLADERGRHWHPRNPAEVRGRGEPGRVGRAAAAERDERAFTVEPQLTPEALERGDRLRLLAGGKLVRRDEPVAERELCGGAVDPADARVGDERDRAVAGDEGAELGQRAETDVNAGSREQRSVEVACSPIRARFVDREPLGVERHELLLVAGIRPVAGLGALPGDRGARPRPGS